MPSAEKVSKTMAYGFLALIVVFAVLAFVYLKSNDFNNETLNIVFPAIGAILLSMYLGFKSVLIDAPEPVRKRVTMALLHDRPSGEFTTMSRPEIDDGVEAFDRFRGLQDFDMLRSYTAFKRLNVWEDLKSDASGPKDSETDVLLDLYEFATLKWLSEHADLSVGYRDFGTVRLLHVGAGAGSVRSDLRPTRVMAADAESNVFISEYTPTLMIRLPKGSTITRARSSLRRTIAIRTRHSRLAFQIDARAGGLVEQSFDQVGKRIRQRLGVPARAPGLWIHGFVAEITTNQAPFSRFADKAKVESEWLARVAERFEIDWSWDLLREYYSA